MNRKGLLLRCLLVCCALTTILACSLPAISAGDKPPSSSPSVHADALALNGAAIASVTASEDGETIGSILSVQITNPSTQEVVATLPCGLVFRPVPPSDEQGLMMIQSIAVTIPPGGTVELAPYVVCIESSSAVPSTGTAYQVAEMTSGDLLKFARCLCEEDLPQGLTSPGGLKDSFGIQIAIWQVADDLSLEQVFSDSEEPGALGDLGPVLAPMIDLMSTASQEWLEKCDMHIEP